MLRRKSDCVAARIEERGAMIYMSP